MIIKNRNQQPARTAAATDTDRTRLLGYYEISIMQRPDHAVNIPILHPPCNDDEEQQLDQVTPLNNSSAVSFGRVMVHRHRMTLGSAHPFASGIPVELSWDVVSSDEMSITDYEDEEDQQQSSSNTSLTDDANHHHRHGSRSPPRRLTSQDRREIAEEHHSRESIFAILKEASLIRHAIVKSLEEEGDLDTLQYVQDDSFEDSLQGRCPSSTSNSSCAPMALPPSSLHHHPDDKTTTRVPSKIPWSKQLCERMQKECQIDRSSSSKPSTTTTGPSSTLPKSCNSNTTTKNLKWSKRLCHRLQDWKKY